MHELYDLLKRTMLKLLENHIDSLPAIRVLYLDLYNSGENERYEIDHVSFMVRPLYKGNEHKSQLCKPQTYAEECDDFNDCQLFSIVAWDHVSWPGNDYWIGSRATDDGVKAAATDTMKVMTGIAGKYDKVQCKYLPPDGYETWDAVVTTNGITIKA